MFSIFFTLAQTLTFSKFNSKAWTCYVLRVCVFIYARVSNVIFSPVRFSLTTHTTNYTRHKHGSSLYNNTDTCWGISEIRSCSRLPFIANGLVRTMLASVPMPLRRLTPMTPSVVYDARAQRRRPIWGRGTDDEARELVSWLCSAVRCGQTSLSLGHACFTSDEWLRLWYGICSVQMFGLWTSVQLL